MPLRMQVCCLITHALRAPLNSTCFSKARTMSRCSSTSHQKGRTAVDRSRKTAHKARPTTLTQTRLQTPKPLPYQSSASSTVQAGPDGSRTMFETDSVKTSPASAAVNPPDDSRSLKGSNQDELRSPGGYLPPSKPIDELRHYRTGLGFKQMSRRITALMTAIPFAVVSAYVLWDRWRTGTLNLE